MYGISLKADEIPLSIWDTPKSTETPLYELTILLRVWGLGRGWKSVDPPISGFCSGKKEKCEFVEIKRNILNQYLMDYLKVYFKELVDAKHGYL